ncbi:NFX1-type zinc finger-containing protein 1-like isoform X3 [Ostrea edulis]|nr:NFX1-type zinc finger-containing protein 1-like isoform X3 [Ostrea edulis]
MGRRKRTRSYDSYRQFRPKRPREKSPFNFHTYTQYVRQQDVREETEITEDISDNELPQDTDESSPSELDDVKDTLSSTGTLEDSDVKRILHHLVAVFDSKTDSVRSLLVKYDFFHRSDVFCMVTESLKSANEDPEEWLENLVLLVISIAEQSNISSRYTKTILGLLSQTKCIRDPVIKDQIKNAIAALQIRENLENLQDDGDSQISLSIEIKEELRGLVSFPILPTAQMIRLNQHLPILPRALKESHKSPAHYLIEQYSLFLEDFIGPLRKGIGHYMEYVMSTDKKERFKDDNIRIYKRIRLLDDKCVPGSGVGLEVQFDMNSFKKIRWDCCSFLQYGNLVCLTYDNCDVLVYALIANRDLRQLTEGKVLLKILNDDQQSINNLRRVQESRLVMIESKSFYMVYDHTLRSLKDMALRMLDKNENIPLAKYLAHLDPEVLEPLYTREENYSVKRVNFRCLLTREKQQSTPYMIVPILDVEKWPTSEEMGLNEYQYQALKMCLTKRIGILQGPPGTGKTWMGLRIMKFLLDNKRVLERGERRPILLLSHTNHALDQFFERVLDLDCHSPRFSDKNRQMPFVRVGGRCANERVNAFSLKEHRKRDRVWSDNRWRIKKSTKYVKYIDAFCIFLQQGIVSLEFLEERNVIHYRHFWSLKNNFRLHKHFLRYEDAILIAWLCIPHAGTNLNSFLSRMHQPQEVDTAELDYLFIQENQKRVLDDDDDESEILEAIFSSFVLTECTNNVKCNTRPRLPFWQKLSTEKSKVLMSYVKRNLRNKDDVMPFQSVRRIQNVWNLNLGDRWRLYRFWIREVAIHFQRERDVVVSHFNRTNQNESDLRFRQNLRILSSCQMVGMTTTGAASNMELLKAVQPRIVVVEEAAQVHEQHILGCLTKDIQHLILIGDHQQLRPTINNYELRCSHKTDVSLMERLVMNGFPFQCLTLQHRMRPEISCLLTPAIYPSLQDHSTVLAYPNVKGMKHSIFFIDHQNPENQTTHSTSYTNDFEVEMIAELYKYLILQGYADSDITILSAYNDQVRKIRKRVSEISQQIEMHRNRCIQQRVHITAVDNFQGEENKIILLSLVRSNKNCKLGHLGDPQRICVLLSRAKEGFYAIGNFQMLYDRGNNLWMKVITKAKDKGILGDAIPLYCENHPEKVTSISIPQDFEKARDGGCDQPCSTQLQCGHICEKRCHIGNSVHESECRKPCLKKLCDEGHLCPKKCYEKCGPCKKQVRKQYSTCKHEVRLPCHQNLEKPCEAECARERKCGHPCKLSCNIDCDSSPCQVKVKAIHQNCHHESTVKCCDKENFTCNVKCKKTLQCGHRCQGNCNSCSNGRLHIPCKNSCSRVLICGHVCDYSHICQDVCPPCKKDCERKNLHNKEIPGSCDERCKSDKKQRNWQSNLRCKDGVLCPEQDLEDGELVPHNRRCRKILKCRHRCTGLREEKCPELCKRCDRAALREIFFGTEEDEDALFIQLIDCRHIFEVESMDTYMQSDSTEYSVKGREVALKKCPKCETPIRRSHRYQNIIRQTHHDIEEVHRKLEEERDQLLFEKYGNMEKYSDFIARILHLESNVCESQNLKTVYLKYILGVKSRNNKLRACSELSTHPEIRNSNLVIIRWIFNHANTIFTQIELEQFTDEVERYVLYADLILMKNQLDSLCLENICQTDRDLLESQITKLRCPDGDTFDREDIVIATSVFDELKRKAPSSSVQCSEEPRRIYVNNVAYRKHGQWFKCESGHIYISADGATADCPECRPVQSDPTHDPQDDGTLRIETLRSAGDCAESD